MHGQCIQRRIGRLSRGTSFGSCGTVVCFVAVALCLQPKFYHTRSDLSTTAYLGGSNSPVLTLVAGQIAPPWTS